MKATVRILTHEFAPYLGGVATYLGETARALAEAGHPTEVWAPDYGGSVADDKPFAVRRVAMRGKQDWLCRLQMARALKQAFPGDRLPGTLILGEAGPLRLWLYRKALRLPRPDRLVLVFHGSEVAALAHSGRRRLQLRSLLREAETIGVVSGEVERLVGAVLPEALPRCHRVPGAVRSTWLGLPPAPWPRPANPVEVVQVGRLHPRKGQAVLLEALARLPAGRLAGLRVRLIGPVSREAYARQLEERIARSRLPVRLDGALPEASLREAYQRAHLAVLPSQPCGQSIEGLGLALLEAQHFACPVIGTRIGGIPEALMDRQTGLLVPPEDPQALAGALEELLAEPDRAARLGEAGARFVRSAFSWSGNARILAGIRCSTHDGNAG